MEYNDHEMEEFLREFTPRRPRALPVAPVHSPLPPQVDGRWNWQRLAAVALLTIASGASIWFAGKQPAHTSNSAILPAPTPAAAASGNGLPSPVILERLALEDPAQFDAKMSAASRQILPHSNAESALRLLSKD